MCFGCLTSTFDNNKTKGLKQVKNASGLLLSSFCLYNYVAEHGNH